MICINRFHHQATKVPYQAPSAHYRGSFGLLWGLLWFATGAASIRYGVLFGSLRGSSSLVSRGSDVHDDLFRTASQRVRVGSGQCYQNAPNRPKFARSSFCGLGFWRSWAAGTWTREVDRRETEDCHARDAHVGEACGGCRMLGGCDITLDLVHQHENGKRHIGGSR